MKQINKKMIIAIILVAIALAGIITTIVFLKNKETVETCEVFFESQGGTKVETKIVEQNGKVAKPADPEKTGFVFKGWYIGENVFDFNTEITQDITLTAKWEADGTTNIYEVEFDSNGGSNVGKIQVSEGCSINEPKSPTKKGYIFAGWYLGEEEFDFTFTISDNIKLVAKWIEDTEENRNIITEKENNDRVVNSEGNGEISNENNKNTKDEYKKLAGTWYLKGYETVTLEFYGGILNGGLQYFARWDNIDLMGNLKLFPTDGMHSSMYLEEFINKYEYYIENNTLHIIKNRTNLNFVREKTPFDVSEYDRYIGVWYYPGYGEKTNIKITKEGKNTYRITTNNFNIETNKYEENYFNSYAMGVFEALHHNKTTIFDKYGIRIQNGNLRVGDGSNYSMFSKTPSDEVFKVTGVKLNKTNMELIQYGQAQLIATIEPENARNLEVKWETSNKNVVDVDQSGRMFAYNIGTATVTVTTVDGNYSASCLVTVKRKPVEKFELSKNNCDIYIGDGEIINININNEFDNPSYSIELENSNPEVVSASRSDRYGYIVLEGIAEGTAIITAKCEGKTASCKVTVSKVGVTGININATTKELKYKDTSQLKANVFPQNATNPNFVWTSSNPDVVQVQQDGTITAKNVGTAVITATTEEGGYTASCNVNVTYKELWFRVSLGYAWEFGSSSFAGIQAKIENVTGGTEEYVYYDIQLYYEGNLIASGSKNCRIPGGENGLYKAVCTVRDSAGNELTITEESEIYKNF